MPVALSTFVVFTAAALAEIAGCFAFWAWLRQGRSILWLAPGVLSLVLFAWLLTLAPSQHAGRAYAAYGGIYIVASLLWLWMAEGQRPDSMGSRRWPCCDPRSGDHPVRTQRPPSAVTLTPVSHVRAFEDLARGGETPGER